MTPTENSQKIGVDLRFRPNSSAAHWQHIFQAIVAWEPRLRPFEWVELSDPDRVSHPWSEAAATDLYMRCATHTATARIIEADSGPTGAITVRVLKSEAAMLCALPRPAQTLDSYFLSLLDYLQGGSLPALGMMFDLEAKHDAEVIFQGLRGLEQVPPYLFLDSAAVEVLGREKVISAPCKVLDAPGGILLISRPDPWARRIGDELRRARAVEQHLGISTSAPLVLA